MSDALIRPKATAERIGGAAATRDADEVAQVRDPLAAERAAAAAKIEEWQQAATVMVPALRQWQAAFNDPRFDRLVPEGRSGRALRLIHESRTGIATTLETFTTTPAWIQNWLAKLDAITPISHKHEPSDRVVLARHHNIYAHLVGRPYGAELIERLEATADEVEELTGGAVRVVRAGSGTSAEVAQQMERERNRVAHRRAATTVGD